MTQDQQGKYFHALHCACEGTHVCLRVTSFLILFYCVVVVVVVMMMGAWWSCRTLFCFPTPLLLPLLISTASLLSVFFFFTEMPTRAINNNNP
jgi:hypothetical protein